MTFPFSDTQRFSIALSFEYGVALCPEDFSGECADCRVIFDHQDGFRTRSRLIMCASFSKRLRSPFHAWKVEVEC